MNPEQKEQEELARKMMNTGEGLEDEQTYESIRIEAGLYLAALGRVAKFETEKSSGIGADMILLTKTPLEGGQMVNLVKTTKEVNGVREIKPVEDGAGNPVVSNIIYQLKFFDANAQTSQSAKNFQNYFRRAFAKNFQALGDDGKIHWKDIAAKVGTVVTFELVQRKGSKYVNMDIDSFSIIPSGSISPASILEIYKLVQKEEGTQEQEPDMPF